MPPPPAPVVCSSTAKPVHSAATEFSLAVEATAGPDRSTSLARVASAGNCFYCELCSCCVFCPPRWLTRCCLAKQISLPRFVDVDWRVDVKTSANTVSRMATPTALIQIQVIYKLPGFTSILVHGLTPVCLIPAGCQAVCTGRRSR